jgi:hypothetical protein
MLFVEQSPRAIVLGVWGPGLRPMGYEGMHQNSVLLLLPAVRTPLVQSLT